MSGVTPFPNLDPGPSRESSCLCWDHRPTSAHRRRLGTTNGLKRLNKEIKRRARVATLFANEASLLRLASAVLSGISDDWVAERAYLTMEVR